MMGGSFAAEHGLGRTKVVLADALRDPVERKHMISIKDALDGTKQLSPGVLVSS
jgi:FAD/FMN-containing dehydrogenase